jgi:hypothetical protein
MSAAAVHLLAAIAGDEPDGGLFEIRSKHAASKWIPTRDTERAATTAISLSRTRETWVGVAVRRRYISPKTGQQFGGSSAIERAWIVSADCDSDAALNALEKFTPAPSFVLTSGGLTKGGSAKLHAHWALSVAVTRPHVSTMKLRLAAALGSDKSVRDVARVMRLPGMLTHKYAVPTECVSIEDHPELTYTQAQVLANCPTVEPTSRTGEKRETVNGARTESEYKQQQERISPRDYVADMAGVEVGSDGKARCPFHDDDTPSLHAYLEPERGWYCYGCRRGGDIYTLGALLHGIPQRELYGDRFDRVWRQVREFYGLKVVEVR